MASRSSTSRSIGRAFVVAWVRTSLGPAPELRLGVQFIQLRNSPCLKRQPRHVRMEEALRHVVDRALDLAFRLGPRRPAQLRPITALARQRPDSVMEAVSPWAISVAVHHHRLMLWSRISRPKPGSRQTRPSGHCGVEGGKDGGCEKGSEQGVALRRRAAWIRRIDGFCVAAEALESRDACVGSRLAADLDSKEMLPLIEGFEDGLAWLDVGAGESGDFSRAARQANDALPSETIVEARVVRRDRYWTLAGITTCWSQVRATTALLSILKPVRRASQR